MVIFLALNMEIKDYNITLVTLYGPNKDDPKFYDFVNNIVKEFDNPHTIICVDWNLVLNDKLDCHNYVNINNPLAKNRVLPVTLCSDLDLIDPWRIHNPDGRRYTWRQHATFKQSRLDFF